MSFSTTHVLLHSLTEQTARDALFTFLANGDFTHADVINEAQILRCRKYHISLHRFQGRYAAQYSALVGINGTETYFETRRVQYGEWGSDFYEEQVAKEREITRWHPVTGNHVGDFDLYVYGGKNVSKQVQSVFECIPTSSGWRTVGQSDIAKLDVEANHSNFAASLQKREPDLGNRIRTDIVAGLAGDHVKDVRLSYSLEKDESVVLNPVYHIEFQYRQKKYNFWIHGCDPCQWAGDAVPVDQKARANAGDAWWTARICTIAVLAALYKSYEHVTGPKLAIAAFIVFVSWIYSSVKHQKILDDSKTARQEAMARRLATPDGKPKKVAETGTAAGSAATQPVRPKQPAVKAEPLVAVQLPQVQPAKAPDDMRSGEGKTLVLPNRVRSIPQVLVAKYQD
ncbi:hypothetical protein [Herbaspirillum sp. SJZ107]|uniref:hypothetical protein n=1 Tax=Herbaspirillum sp. SJZ107 TaxID=2572881 RepID=UPI00114EA3CB|nr:hypothetical protein [Herbaspirillum sp. SJZ107]TQK01131.1 hypothetical protein FBX97_5646 [Herbaspirillum sp. SJZ107]